MIIGKATSINKFRNDLQGSVFSDILLNADLNIMDQGVIGTSQSVFMVARIYYSIIDFLNNKN
jgi:hypothetical protein